MQVSFPIEAMLTKLEACRVEVATKGKRKALRAGGKVIKEAMQEAAPVLAAKMPGSNSLPPGALRDGMRVALVDEGAEPEALVGPRKNVAHVARWVEFGHRQISGGTSVLLPNGTTRGRGKATDKRHKLQDVPAHPFLRPAYEQSIGPAKTALAASLAETIQKEVA